MTVYNSEEGLWNANPRVVSVTGVALIAGLALTIIMATIRPSGYILLSIPLLMLLLSALSAYWSGSYTLALMLGLVPLHGAGIGEGIYQPYNGPLVVGIANLILLLSFWGIIIATTGFLLGVAGRYRGQLTDHTRRIAIRVGISGAICVMLFVAAENNWISFSVEV